MKRNDRKQFGGENTHNVKAYKIYIYSLNLIDDFCCCNNLCGYHIRPGSPQR